MNGEKTEKMMYVSGVNCRPDTAIYEMQDTKKRFDKEDGIISYHLIQSFDGKEISPKKCHELGLQYAKELFGDDFQFVVATHLNTDNVHNHIVINSVSFKSGYKFYSNRETKDFIRITSDFICRENGLSVIKTPWKNKGYYKLYAKNNPYMQLVKKIQMMQLLFHIHIRGLYQSQKQKAIMFQKMKIQELLLKEIIVTKL